MLEHAHTLSRLWRMPHAGREQLLAFQFRNLTRVIRWAYDRVPYYRTLFTGAGIKPDDIRSLADLAVVPITSSQEYRTRPLSDTLARHVRPDRLVRRATSGSSGRPFIIRRTAWEDLLLNQFRWRALRSFGVRPGDRFGAIRLVSRSHQRDTLAGRARQTLGLYRQYLVDSRQPAPDIIRQLCALRPEVVTGYPSVLTHVGHHLQDSPEPELHPRLIITGGETMVGFRRWHIERGFGCPAFDTYGSHEFNLLAWQCRNSGDYHVCEDNLVLEILKDGRSARAGERGEVVATGLHTYAMPFIRYRLGDVATRGPELCSCGAPFATLRAVEGRMHDYFTMPDGTLIHPDRLVVPIMEAEAPWFDRYRLVQVRPDEIVLHIQPFRIPTAEQLARVRDIGSGQLPATVRFSVQIVERLDVEDSGKFRFCRSLVGSHLDSPHGQTP